MRREWRSRLVDHDGEREGDGGIARWLKLTDGLGLDRDYVTSLRGLLPGTRFAVEAYVRFVREKTLLEAIASSLTELFSPVIISERIERHAGELRVRHPRDAGLFRQAPAAGRARRRFRARLRQAARPDPEQQQAVLAALEFKCGVLWAMLDALHSRLCDAKAHAARRICAGGVAA